MPSPAAILELAIAQLNGVELNGARAKFEMRLTIAAMQLVKRALELSATAVVLVHNHPSGDPTPSRADIEMTKSIVEAARPFGIEVHDHIIVGKEGHASLKGLKLIP